MKRIINKNSAILTLLIASSMILLGGNVYAEFSSTQVNRLTKARDMLKDAEKRQVKEIINEFETTGSPQAHLEIYEAMAKTFKDIIDEYGENTPEARAQLLGKIKLNMAYFQLSGSTKESPGGSELNRLIQRKLKHYLPDDIWDNDKLFHSLD